MVPIQDVLHRIQWDPSCRGHRFDIGYLDRVAGAVVRVPLADAHLDAARPASLILRDAAGVALRIPLHRVRVVWRDGVSFWARRAEDALQSPHGVDPHD
jgi:uncharacterized protein (UPF0248 family)